MFRVRVVVSLGLVWVGLGYIRISIRVRLGYVTLCFELWLGLGHVRLSWR